jgi:hypothetical protein
MRRLHQKVNIVPIIAKADCLTAPEIKRLKQRVLSEIEDQHIQVSISFGRKHCTLHLFTNYSFYFIHDRYTSSQSVIVMRMKSLNSKTKN